MSLNPNSLVASGGWMDAGCRRMLEDVSGDAGGGWLVASGHNGPEGGEIRQPHGACLEEVRGMGHKAPSPLALDEGQQHAPCHITDW